MKTRPVKPYQYRLNGKIYTLYLVDQSQMILSVNYIILVVN